MLWRLFSSVLYLPSMTRDVPFVSLLCLLVLQLRCRPGSLLLPYGQLIGLTSSIGFELNYRLEICRKCVTTVEIWHHSSCWHTAWASVSLAGRRGRDLTWRINRLGLHGYQEDFAGLILRVEKCRFALKCGTQRILCMHFNELLRHEETDRSET